MRIPRTFLLERQKIFSGLFLKANSIILSLMNRSNQPVVLAPTVGRFLIGMLVAGLFTLPVLAQADKVQRDLVPAVNVTSVGEGPPILLRWLATQDAASTLQVSTRTVPTLLENGLSLKEDTEATLAKTPRPPLERFWTIQGRIRETELPSMPRAQWRVLDGAARLYMLRPAAVPEATVENDDRERPTKSAPIQTKPGPDRPDPTGSQIPSASKPNSSAFEKARAFARVQDNAISRCAGAAISQQFSGDGLVPTSIQIRLETASPRTMYEVERLTSILRLSGTLIPNQPIGIGGTWVSRWTNLEQRTPVETVMTWTLASVDDAALEATGIAETAVLKVRYTRRIVQGLDDEPVAPRLITMLESDGNGEIRLIMRNPMHLDAQLVQMPVRRDPKAPGAVEVTRMRVITTE